ncbi:MAG TPA: sialidase family protein, partial [Chitinophagaceae bacterium]|nr:sialidase family protein [Chitinophagaceae bacterium]
VTRYGAVEPVAIELNDGRIWMLIRTNKGYLYESFSHDSGKSWDEAKQTSFISSDSPASFLRLSNGEIVLFLNSDQRYDDKRSYANGGREALQAALSKDETQTWMGFREVLVSPATKPAIKGDRGTAYPSAIETAKGNILLVSGQGEEAAIIMFNKKWLEETQQKDNINDGPVNWTFHGTNGRAGVWNFPMAKKGKLIIKIKIKSPVGPFDFALTDHFSVAYDSLASKMSPFKVSFQRNDLSKKINKVTLRWDNMSTKGAVYLNNKKISDSKFQFRPTGKGYNYLRVSAGPQAGNINEICTIAMISE